LIHNFIFIYIVTSFGMTSCHSLVDGYQYFGESDVKPDNEIIAFLQNVGTHQLDNVVPWSRRRQYESPLLSKYFFCIFISVVSFTDIHKKHHTCTEQFFEEAKHFNSFESIACGMHSVLLNSGWKSGCVNKLKWEVVVQSNSNRCWCFW
jgi:hypothetical protein